uniref:RNase P component 2 n=1 Tax=Ignisphaera aggregans TaxID=334771 RepID=A0A7C2VH68_9CREN
MELHYAVAWIALLVSVASLAISIAVLFRVYSYVRVLVEEFGKSLVAVKKHRRVKRYILVRFLCIDNQDYNTLENEIKNSVYSFLGPILKSRCSVDIISYRPESRRAIIRVRGEAVCVTYTLLALSIQHLRKNMRNCITIPVRTTGLISRLRRRYLKR